MNERGQYGRQLLVGAEDPLNIQPPPPASMLTDSMKAALGIGIPVVLFGAFIYWLKKAQ